MSDENQIETTGTITSTITHEDILESLENELKERIRLADIRSGKAIGWQHAAVCEAIRIGWLVRDVQDQLKYDATMSFKDWIESRFKKIWSVAEALRMAKISKEFQCDAAYNTMRDRFGLDPKLISATSEETLEVQVENRSKQPEYVPLIRSVGLAPAKGESKPREKKEPKSEKEKVLRSLRLTFDRYLKFKESRETWDGEVFELVVGHLRQFKDEYEYLTNGGHVPEGEGGE